MSQLIGHVCMSVGVFVLILENNIVIILIVSKLSKKTPHLKKHFLLPMCAYGSRYVRKLVDGHRLCSCACHIIFPCRFVPVPHDISGK